MKKLFLAFAVLGVLMLAIPASAAQEFGWFPVEQYNGSGELVWAGISPNNLADEGEQLFLDVVLRGATAPTGFELRLWNDTPVDTDTVSTLTGEPSGNGYSAKTVENSATGWTSLALDSGDYMATSKTVTWTASGGAIGPVTYITLTTATSNKLVSYAALSTTRTLSSGDSLQATYKVKLQ